MIRDGSLKLLGSALQCSAGHSITTILSEKFGVLFEIGFVASGSASSIAWR